MKLINCLLIIALISCDQKEIYQERLTYAQSEMAKDGVEINLPEFKNGFDFKEIDSVDYINIYLINDSTIQVNETRFELNKIENPKVFMAPRYLDEFEPSKKFDCEEALNFIVDNHLKSNSEILLFIDTNATFVSYDNVLANTFEMIKNSKIPIKIMGIGSFIEIRNSRFVIPNHTICGGGQPNFTILINSKNQLMINNDWEVGVKDISNLLKEFYCNSNDSQNLPTMISITKKHCEEELAYLKENLVQNSRLEFDTIIKERLEEWNQKLITTKLLGSYRTIPKYCSIYILADSKTQMNFYYKIIDEINKSLLELRNDLSKNHFEKSYSELNCNDSLDKLRIQAVNEVFPVIINPSVYYPRLPPPPPPPF